MLAHAFGAPDLGTGSGVSQRSQDSQRLSRRPCSIHVGIVGEVRQRFEQIDAGVGSGWMPHGVHPRGKILSQGNEIPQRHAFGKPEGAAFRKHVGQLEDLAMRQRRQGVEKLPETGFG